MTLRQSRMTPEARRRRRQRYRARGGLTLKQAEWAAGQMVGPRRRVVHGANVEINMYERPPRPWWKRLLS